MPRTKGAAILGEIIAKGTFNSLKSKAKNLTIKKAKTTAETVTNNIPRVISIE